MTEVNRFSPIIDDDPEAAAELEAKAQKPKTGTILDLTPDEVIQKFDRGEVTEAEANRYASLKEYEEKGLHGSSVDTIEDLYGANLLSEDDVNAYVDRKKSPTKYYLKDTVRGAARGVQNILKPLLESAIEGSDFAASMHGGADDIMEAELQPTDLPDVVGPTRTLPGKVTEIVTEFGVPFAAGLKVARGVKVTSRMLQTGAFKALSEKAPQLANYLATSTDYILAGTAVDFAQYPAQGHLADWINEKGMLPEYLDFLTRKEDNPAFIERLKGVAEGAGVGLMVDALIRGVKVGKRWLWTSNHGDPDLVDRAVDLLQKGRTKRLEATGMAPEQAAAVAAKTEFKETFSPEVTRLPVPGAKEGDAAFLKQLADAADHAKAEDVIQAIFRQDAEIIAAARGGKQTLEGITQEARKLEIKVAEGEAEEAIQQLATVSRVPLDEARQRVLDWMGKDMTVKDAATKIVAMKEFTSGQVRAAAEAAEKALVSKGTPELAEAYASARFAGELLSKLMGVRAEFGRGLGAFRRAAGGGRFGFDKASPAEIKLIEDTSRGELISALEVFVAAHKKGQGLEAVRSLDKLKTLRGVAQYVQANLLWNFSTQVVNFASNVGIGLDHYLNKLAGGVATGSLDTFGKALKGWMYGAHKALKFMDAWRLGQAGESKLAYSELGNVWKAMWEGRGIIDQVGAKEGLVPFRETPGAKQTLWSLLTGNFRLMSGVDEFFKNTTYYSQLFEDISLVAKRKGKTFGEELSSALPDIPAELHDRAIRVAQEVTLTEPLRHNTFSKKIVDGLNNSRMGLLTKILAVPFAQVPLNLGRWAGRHSPLGFFSKKVQEDIAAGGIRRAQAVSGIVTGTGMITLGIGLAASGRITGAVPRGQEAAWRNSGKMPYSIKIGDTWYSMSRFDPFAITLGTAANLWNFMEMAADYTFPEDENAALETTMFDLVCAASATVFDASLNKAFMQSTKEIVDLAFNTEAAGERRVQRLITSQAEKFIPWSSLPNNWNATDVKTEFFSGWDAAYKRFDPSKLVARRNTVTGEILMESGISIARGLKERQETVFKELERVGASPQGFPKTISKTRKRGLIDVKGELSRQEYDRLWTIYANGYGPAVMEELSKTIQDERYTRITDRSIQKRALLSIVSKGRSKALKQFLSGDSEVKSWMTDEFRRQALALRGLYLSDDPMEQGQALREAGGNAELFDPDLGVME